MDQQSRRKFTRIEYPCQIIISPEQGTERILTHAKNISASGICVNVKKQLKILTCVDIQIDLLDFNQPIACRGRVIWTVPRSPDHPQEPEVFETGIEFTEIQEIDRLRLAETILRLKK